MEIAYRSNDFEAVIQYALLWLSEVEKYYQYQASLRIFNLLRVYSKTKQFDKLDETWQTLQDFFNQFGDYTKKNFRSSNLAGEGYFVDLKSAKKIR